MTQDQVVVIAQRAMWVTLEVGLPILVVALIVGLSVSILQAVTQLQEPTLTFIPKILAIFLVIALAGPWMLNTLMDFTTELWQMFPTGGA